MTPLKFGLQQFNYLAAQGLLVIFNLYGKRLLKIEDDKFIKSCDCIENYNYFKLYPLILNQLSQDLFLSTFLILNGTVSDAVIRVPWKALLSDYTLITIEKVDLNIEIRPVVPPLIKSLNQTVPYLNESTTPNQEITSTFTGIKEILKKYFNYVVLEVKMINLVIGQLHVKISGIKYQHKVITIQTIQLTSSDNITENLTSDGSGLGIISNVTINLDLMQVDISSIKIDSRIVEYLPTIYLNDSPSQTILNIKIHNLIYDTLTARHIDLTLKPNEYTLNSLVELLISQIIELRTEKSPILSLNLSQSICTVYQPIHVNLLNVTQLKLWIDSLKHTIKLISSKIRITKTLQSPKEINSNFCVSNLLLKLIYNNIPFNIHINSINCSPIDINLQQVKVLYMDVDLEAINCEIVNSTDNTSITVSGLHVTSPSRLQIQSNILHIGISNQQILISLEVCDAWNLLEIINKIRTLVENINRSNITHQTSLFMTAREEIKETLVEEIRDPITDSIRDDIPEPAPVSRPIILRIIDSNIHDLLNMVKPEPSLVKPEPSLVKPEPSLVIHIIQGSLNISTMIATDIQGQIFIDTITVAKLLIEKLSRKEIIVKTVNVYIDPNIAEAMVKIVEYLKSTMSTTTDATSIPTVVASMPMISPKSSYAHSRIIEDYRPKPTPDTLDISIKIKQLSAYIFNNITKSSTNFVNLSFKNLHFAKHIKLDLIKYEIGLEDMIIIDLRTKNPEWKHILKSQSNAKFLELVYKISTRPKVAHHIIFFITPIVISLREEIVVEFLNFFKPTPKSNSIQVVPIENCYIYPLDIILNYHPIITGSSTSDLLSIHNYRIKLPAQSISHLTNFPSLFKIIVDNIKKKVNPNNIIQFVPHVKIIEPYASPVIRILKIVTQYMKHVNNHTKVNKLTRKIAKGYGLANMMVNMGIKNIWQIFT